MKTSESVKEIFPALVKAQSEIGNAKTKEEANIVTKTGAKFGYKYADLAGIMDVSKGALTKNNLAVIQAPSTRFENNQMIVDVTTRIIHASGEWIEDTLSLKPTETDPQKLGSCITYGRRYSWAALLGIAQEDDDANSASGNKLQPNNSYKKQEPEGKWNIASIEKVITKDTLTAIKTMALGQKAVVTLFEKYNGDQQLIISDILGGKK